MQQTLGFECRSSLPWLVFSCEEHSVSHFRRAKKIHGLTSKLCFKVMNSGTLHRNVVVAKVRYLSFKYSGVSVISFQKKKNPKKKIYTQVKCRYAKKDISEYRTQVNVSTPGKFCIFSKTCSLTAIQKYTFRNLVDLKNPKNNHLGSHKPQDHVRDWKMEWITTWCTADPFYQSQADTL